MRRGDYILAVDLPTPAAVNEARLTAARHGWVLGTFRGTWRDPMRVEAACLMVSLAGMLIWNRRIPDHGRRLRPDGGEA